MFVPPCRFIVLVGLSTGGPRMYAPLFQDMPALPGCIVVVQHMPRYVNENVCATLSGLTRMQVKLASDGDPVHPGMLYVAPSERHLRFIDNNARLSLKPGPRVNYCCPSIDIAMLSLVKNPGQTLVGAVLTGMGSDGAAGIAHIKSLGGLTLAQDEASCVIYGIPKAAIDTGCVDHVLPPEEMRRKLIETLR